MATIDAKDAELQRLAEHLVDLCARTRDPNETIDEVVQRANAMLVEKSRSLPPQKVLLNTCYGGFSFSDAFQNFRRNLEGTADAHKDVCDQITAFGRNLALEFPFVFETILFQEAFDVRAIAAGANKKENHNQKRRIDQGELEDDEQKQFQEQDDVMDVHALVEYIVKSYVARTKTIYGHDDRSVTNRLLNFCEAIEIYGQVDGRLWLETNNGYLGKSHAIAVGVLHDDDARVNIETAYAMLTSCGDVVVELENRACTRLGLLAAAGPYCVLNIQTVPAMCAYDIREYDGFESIVVRPG